MSEHSLVGYDEGGYWHDDRQPVEKFEYCDRCGEPVKAGFQCGWCGAVDGVAIWEGPENDDWIQRLWWDANPPRPEPDTFTRMVGR